MAETERMEILEDTAARLVIRNTYPQIGILVRNLVLMIFAAVGVFLIVVRPSDPQDLEIAVRVGAASHTLHNQAAWLFLRASGIAMAVGSAWALSVKCPELVILDRQAGEIAIQGKSWFGIVPYRETIPFQSVVATELSKNYSVVMLPLTSGKQVFLGVTVDRALLEKLIDILQSPTTTVTHDGHGC